MSNTRMSQVEFLLRLSENARDKGEDLTRNQDQIYRAHAQDLVELGRMIELAKANIDIELQRFARWIARDESPRLGKSEQMPRVVAGEAVKTRGG